MRLKETAFKITPGPHAVLLLYQVGWRTLAESVVPANMTLRPLL